ncbi:MAG: DUF4738 domain-containing protein [Bacteroidaceae bacterium]|nr:DUF4738 domain-containing protein [Bacteroidaceae bacterium]
MKNISYILIGALALGIGFTSCKEEKKQDVIIVNTPKEASKPKGTIAKDSISESQSVQWGDAQYTVKVSRKADKTLPIVKNEETGDKYYDNSVTVRVLREDNSEAISKTFTKDNFREHIAKEQYADYSLLIVSFMEAEGNNLKFVVALGDPDDNSDNYINLQMLISKTGNIVLKPLVIDEITGDEADLDV